MKFRWDPAKAHANLRKHRISFREAATALHDAFSSTFPDPEHSDLEVRYVTIGLSAERKLLVVAHLEAEDGVRIISARRATRRERRFYEEGN